ncbi:MAG: hypothetical protein ACRETX_08935, partial [Steroidobacteraceae bacterium]
MFTRLLVIGVMLALGIASTNAQTLADSRPGLARLLAAYDGVALTRGIATFDAIPTATQVAALQGLGLAVQP